MSSYSKSGGTSSRPLLSLKTSTSILTLVMASGFATQTHAQTSISNGNNTTVTSTVNNEMISLGSGDTSSTANSPNVVIANNDVTLDVAGTLSSTGVTNTVQINADAVGSVINTAVTGIIIADSRAINVDGDDTVINNSGQILGTGDQRNGVIYGNRTSNGLVINNVATGVVDAGAGNQGAAVAIEVGGGGAPITGSVTNAGLLQGRGQAVATGGTAGDGLRFFGPGLAPVYQYNGDVTNSGTITSESAVGTTAGVRFANRINFGGTLINEEAGTISGVQNGLYFGEADHTGGIVDNAGVISSDSRALNIDGTSLVVNNSGSILGTGNQRNGAVYADSTAQDFTLNNTSTGVIDAGVGNEGAGFSVELDAAGNDFTINNDGTIQGRGQAGAGVAGAGDGLRFERTRVDGALDGTTAGLFTGDISNTGTIASESAQGTAAGIRFVNGVSFNGTIDNSGTISGEQNGLYFGNATPAGGGDFTGAVVNNSGTISSGSRALNIDGRGLVVNNSGSILGTGNQRNGTVYADSTAQDFTLNNTSTGVIDAGMGNEGAGFSVELDAAGNDFTINNDGTIQGRGQAGAGVAGAGDGLRFERTRVDGALDGTTAGLFTGDISNTGTIASESAQGTAAGIRFVNGVSFNGTIDNSGTISGEQNGLYFGNATPAGGGDFTGAVVNNSGTISSGSRALNIDGTGLVVNNSGSILGTGDQRNGTIYADTTANAYTFNNLSSGIVDAGIGNNGSGVSLQFGNVDGETVSFTLTNAGTIAGRGTENTPAGLRIFQGAENVTVDGNITNSGTISSENGAAILIEGVDFVGTITNSGVLSGTSVLDASTATGGVTFNQIGGAFNADFIGSNFDDTLAISGANFELSADVLGGVATSVDAATAVSVSGARALEGDLVSNGELQFELGSDSLNVAGNTTFGANSVVTVTTNANVNEIVLNSPITVISETGTFTDNGLSVNVIDDDFLIDYDVLIGSVVVTATAADLSNVSTDSNVSAFASAIGASFAAGQLTDDIANTFNATASNAEFEGNVASLLPTLNKGVSREIWETHSKTASFVTDRLNSNVAAGAWVQGSTRSADRDGESLSVEGYGADTTAVTFGYDRRINDTFRLGASYTFASTDIDEDTNAGESNDLDTNQIAAYAGYEAGKVFVSGQAGYVFGDGESTRVSDLGTVTSEYDVDAFTAQATASFDLGLFRPQAGLRYGTVSQAAFTENGGLNLNVDADNVNYLEGIVGVAVSPNLPSTGHWSVKPTVRANYVLDFVNDDRDVNITLAGSPSQLLTSEGGSGSRFEIGAGLDLAHQSGVTIGVAYEGDFASGYSSNAGLIRARVNF